MNDGSHRARRHASRATTHWVTTSWLTRAQTPPPRRATTTATTWASSEATSAWRATARKAIARRRSAIGTAASTVGTTESTRARSTGASSGSPKAAASSGAHPDEAEPTGAPRRPPTPRTRCSGSAGRPRRPAAGRWRTRGRRGSRPGGSPTSPRRRHRSPSAPPGGSGRSRVTKPLARMTHFCAVSQSTPDAARRPRPSPGSRCPSPVTGHGARPSVGSVGRQPPWRERRRAGPRRRAPAAPA